MEEGQTVHMLQIATFRDMYYACSTLFDNIFIEDAMPEKSLKYALFQNNLDQNPHF